MVTEPLATNPGFLLPRKGRRSIERLRYGASWLIVGPGLVLVVLASPASAEKVKPEGPGREKAAQKACALGDYQKGVDILADMLVDSDDPKPRVQPGALLRAERPLGTSHQPFPRVSAQGRQAF